MHFENCWPESYLAILHRISTVFAHFLFVLSTKNLELEKVLLREDKTVQIGKYLLGYFFGPLHCLVRLLMKQIVFSGQDSLEDFYFTQFETNLSTLLSEEVVDSNSFIFKNIQPRNQIILVLKVNVVQNIFIVLSSKLHLQK